MHLYKFIFKDEYTGEVKQIYITPEVNPLGGGYFTDLSGKRIVSMIVLQTNQFMMYGLKTFIKNNQKYEKAEMKK